MKTTGKETSSTREAQRRYRSKQKAGVLRIRLRELALRAYAKFCLITLVIRSENNTEEQADNSRQDLQAKLEDYKQEVESLKTKLAELDLKRAGLASQNRILEETAAAVKAKHEKVTTFSWAKCGPRMHSHQSRMPKRGFRLSP